MNTFTLPTHAEVVAAVADDQTNRAQRWEDFYATIEIIITAGLCKTNGARA